MNTKIILRGVAAGALLLVAGCSGGDLSRTFGMTRDAPDEFTVTTRAPLSMPPDFTLRPPQPGAGRPQEQSTAQTAQATVTGASVFTAAPAQAAGPNDSAGLQALLSAAGQPAPADIRSQVDADAAHSANDHTLAETLLFWQTKSPPGTVVDPAQEAARLRENAALGQSPDTGDTPVIKRKTTSFFDNLF